VLAWCPSTRLELGKYNTGNRENLVQLEHGIYDRKPIEDIDNDMYVQIVDEKKKPGQTLFVNYFL